MLDGHPAHRNVWSAAVSQAKNESDRSVCANVYGLCWSTTLLAMMECAAPSSCLVGQSWKTSSGYRLRAHREAPSLPRHCPASSVLRASPSPHTARPFSREQPVDLTAITAGASRVALGPLLPACRRHYPGRFGGSCWLVPFPLIGLPRVYGGSAAASWFSRPAQRSLTLRPACLPSRLRDPSTPEASAA